MKLSLFLVTIMLASSALGGCGKPGGGGEGTNAPTVGTTGKTSDKSTVQTIEERIKAEKSLDGATITVTEASGSISLEGTVKNQDQKDKAESIVTAVQKEKGQQTGVLDNLMIESK